MTDVTVPIQPGPSPRPARDFLGRVAAPEAKVKAQRQVAVVHLFCPPITSDHCVGTLALQTVAARHQHAIAIAKIRFTLPPGRLGDFTIRLPSGLTSLVFSRHHLRVLATVTAHDRARPPRHKRTRKILLFVPAPKARAGAPPLFMP